MNPIPKHKWTFRARFRRHAFGWRSQPAIKRIKEAVSEIKKEARQNPVLGAEGAVLFLEKVSPAIEQVDSSSGAIGSAVYNAIVALIPIISNAQAEDKLYDKWMEHLWNAVQDDDIPYLELLPEYWGELCVTPERASRWADEFIETVRNVLSPHPDFQYFVGTSACLSSLLKAGRNEEILQLLDLSTKKYWHYRKLGVKALAAMNRISEAIQYAEDSRGLNDNVSGIAMVCEEILLASCEIEEAYNRYAIVANQKTTYLSTFRAITKKYPHKDSVDILHNLVASTPGDEGKWFAAAKSAGLYNEAIVLANRTFCDPRTLTRAARDFAVKRPGFAMEAGIAALRWLIRGYGYEITGLDVEMAYDHTIEAAVNIGCLEKALDRVRKLVSETGSNDSLVIEILNRKSNESV